jgi:hypothetical protein
VLVVPEGDSGLALRPGEGGLPDVAAPAVHPPVPLVHALSGLRPPNLGSGNVPNLTQRQMEEDTPEQFAVREEVREWLQHNVPRPPLASISTRDGFEAHRASQQMLSTPDPSVHALNHPRSMGHQLT